MPELPEVNTVQKRFIANALEKTISSVHVTDSKIFRGISKQDFISNLCGRSFVGTYRQGKYLFAALDDGQHLQFHLGMTGDIVYYSDRKHRPKFERFYLKFTDRSFFGYDDPRKFSQIKVIENLPVYLDEIGLGPDALSISREEFGHCFEDRRTSLKSILLNQKLIAGIGNLYADEICYQSKIHPGSTAAKLTSRHLDILFARMRSILIEACDKDAYYGVYPDDWFWKWRTLKDTNPNPNGPVQKSKIAGRTTYYVEGYQKLIT